MVEEVDASTDSRRFIRSLSARQAALFLGQLFRDPLIAYDRLRHEHGDTVRLPYSPRRSFFFLSRPEYAEQVLVAHQDRYVKAFTYRPLKAFLGDGLLTSEGERWQAHRRLIQPVFGARRIGAFAPQIVAAARTRVATWHPDAAVDVAAEMRTLTMDAVGRVLFGTDLAARAQTIGAAVTRLQDAVLIASLLPSGGSPQRTRALATRLIPGVGAAANTLDGLVEAMIDERLADPRPEPRDLLDLLVAARDDDGLSLERQEIRDEVMTLVLAGHETTANALAWTLMLLSKYPDVRERLHAEVDDVLTGRDATAEDVDKLVWTQAVVSESMRLYPPAWTIERDAAVDDVVAGVPVPAGSTVAIPPYLIHRHPEFWPNPEGFDPQRFLPGADPDRPRYAYLPFGGGRRICVGAGFAMLEATLMLATITSGHRLDLVPNVEIGRRAGVTMHPGGPIPMTVSRR